MSKSYRGVALYSGGTDSTLAPILARQNIGDNILLLMIDLGSSSGSIEQAKERAEILGLDFKVIDGISEFTNRFLSEAIKMNGSYFGYPLGTPMGRAFMMELAVKFLDENINIERYVIHGCNAFQNTRYRIEKLCKTEEFVAPIGPLVHHNYSRQEKCDLLKNNNIKTVVSDNYATDENIFCRALEGDFFNDLSRIKNEVFVLTVNPIDAPDQPVEISLEFQQGLPIKMNSEDMCLEDIIIACRNLGGKHGIGRIVSLEDTISVLGYKERGVYESPSSVILYTAHRYIEDAVLNKTERLVKKDLEVKWSDIVYNGDWFSSERTQISEYCAQTNHKVNGIVWLQLYKGNVTVLDAQIPGSLLIGKKESVGAY